jgi:polysaccharide export outer membrane protein
MTARRLMAPRWALAFAALGLAPALSGCGLLKEHQARKIPHLGGYDADQPRELQMVSQPPYVVEPPDELEIYVRPAALEVTQTTVTVQSDGVIDLGFYGDVYVAGLTLTQIEDKIAEHLTAISKAKHMALHEPVQCSVRLVNGSASKRHYVLGTVTNQGSFPSTGNETVLDAILTAGLRSNSIPEKAYLARPSPTGGPPEILRIDWEEIRNGNTFTNYQLFPGDRIYVPGGRPPGLLSTLTGGG